jgi:hypothetical protein
MSLLAKLEAKGLKVYSGTPLWVAQGKAIAISKIGDNCVVQENNGTYKGHSLVIEEGEKRMYVPLKQGVSPEKSEYTLQEFAASRDWEEYNISAGDTKVFAV